MSEYRRYLVPGGTYFFTLVAFQRRRLFAVPEVRRGLGDCIRECQKTWPFRIPAIVLLHDHLHALWSLPPGDDGYSQRWGWIKKEFHKRSLPDTPEVWQRRFLGAFDPGRG